MGAAEGVGRARHLDDDHLHQLGVVPVGVDDERGDRIAASPAGRAARHRPRRSPRASRPSAPGTACRGSPPWRRSSGRRGRRRHPPRRRCPTPGRCESPAARTPAPRRRGSRGACRPPAVSHHRLRRGVVEVGGDAPATAAGAGCRAAQSKSRSATITASRVGSGGEHQPPGIDDHRAPAAAVTGRMRADLVGRDHEALVLDRPGPQQHLPVVARGRRA